MAVRLISGPALPVLSLAEARMQLRVTATGSPAAHPEDDLIAAYVQAATDELDAPAGWLNRALITQTWELLLDAFPGDPAGIRLPFPPLQTLVSVKYRDGDNVLQTMASADYRVDGDSEPAFLAPGDAGWPATYDTLNAVTIRFICGYGDAGSDVPELIRSYIRLRLGALYAQREAIGFGVAISEVPWVRHSLEPYRVRGAHM